MKLGFFTVIIFAFIMLILRGSEFHTREEIYPDFKGTIGTEKIDTITTKKYKFKTRLHWQNN